MTKQDELIAAITASVMAAIDIKLDERLKKIACPLEWKERQSVKRLYGMLTDIGEGDTDKGIRLARNLLEFGAGVQTKKTVVTGAIFTIMVLGIIGTAGSFLWCAIKAGFKEWVMK